MKKRTVVLIVRGIFLVMTVIFALLTLFSAALLIQGDSMEMVPDEDDYAKAYLAYTMGIAFFGVQFVYCGLASIRLTTESGKLKGK